MNGISFNHRENAVRVCYGGRHGKQKYFTIKEHGSLWQAVKAAEEFHQCLPESVRLTRFNTIQNVSNQSGVTGVCRILNKKGDEVGWKAFWQEGEPGNRRHRNKGFYFGVCGRETFETAVAYREKMVREHSSWMFQ